MQHAPERPNWLMTNERLLDRVCREVAHTQHSMDAGAGRQLAVCSRAHKHGHPATAPPTRLHPPPGSGRACRQGRTQTYPPGTALSSRSPTQNTEAGGRGRSSGQQAVLAGGGSDENAGRGVKGGRGTLNPLAAPPLAGGGAPGSPPGPA